MYQKDFQALIDDLPGLLFIKDKKSHYLAMNKRLKKLCGFGLNENILGRIDEDMPWGNRSDGYRFGDRDIISNRSPKMFFEPVIFSKNSTIEVIALTRKSP